jgi:hypothetical protein
MLDPNIISTVVNGFHTIASLLHGDDASKVADTVRALTAAVAEQLPDGAQITEAELLAHADQIIADAQKRRERINDDGA